MRQPDAMPSVHPNTDQILSSVPKAEGNPICYTYILIFIYLNKGETDPFVCFQDGAKPGVASKL